MGKTPVKVHFFHGLSAISALKATENNIDIGKYREMNQINELIIDLANKDAFVNLNFCLLKLRDSAELFLFI